MHSAKFPSEQLTRNLREAVMREGVDQPVVNDAGFQVWNAYGARAWPTLALVDPGGYLVAMQSGEILAEELEPMIAEIVALAEQTGQLDRTPLELQPERAREPARALRYPARVLPAGDGRLFVADSGHHRVLALALDPDGRRARVQQVFGDGAAGLVDGPAESARFNSPHGLSLAGETLYVADSDNHAVRAIDLASGRVRTLAGTGAKAHGGYTLGEPTETALRSPWAVLALDPTLVFIAMAGSHQIWVLLNGNQLGPFAGSGREALADGPRAEAGFNQPSDLAYAGGYLFVADPEASAVRAVTLDADPRVFTLVGQGLFEFGDVDGTGGEVRLQHPTGLAFDHAARVLYVADSYNHKIKRLDPTTGRVDTLIGTGRPGAADGPLATAELYEPEGVAVHDGRLFIADTNNHAIRVADLEAGEVYTLGIDGA